MDVQNLSSDIISTVPPNIVEKILCLLPIKEAVRTSILSRKWRYSWANIPKVVFDEALFEKSTNSDQQSMKSKFLLAIYQVLLLHRGPILEFCLSIEELLPFSEIDQIILHLSRSNTVKIFTFVNRFYDHYKFPASFFLLQQLTYLNLESCIFQPPYAFSGFSELTKVSFIWVEITPKRLQHFFSNCPRLKNLILIRNDDGFVGINECKFVDLFECLPLIEDLCISMNYIKCFAAGGVPQKLTTSLVHLKCLSLIDFCFMEQDELSSILCLIRSSPNLETIKIKMHEKQMLPIPQTHMGFLELQDCLNHLKELEMKYLQNPAPKMEFVKLIMSKSPKLQKARIQLHDNVTVGEELKMLRGLVRWPFPRASPSAEFIVESPPISP